MIESVSSDIIVLEGGDMESFVNISSELVIGIVQPVGTNSSDIIQCIKDSLEKYGYKTYIVKVSKDVLSAFDNDPNADISEFERINKYMDLGNNVRKQSGDAGILMAGVASCILEKYRKSEKNPLKQTAFIVDSIKHPGEVDYLRQLYGDGFHLIGISDSYENREKNLINRKVISEEDAKKLLNRDNNEAEENGQHTRDAFQQADYFIDASENREKYEADVSRLLDLIFGNPFLTPTFEEYAMFRAYVSSLKSADLSRQIGSVVTKNKDILAEGANDCPKAFGGPYWSEYKDGQFRDEDGGRDYMLGYDSNKIEQENIIKSIINSLGIEDNQENFIKIKKSDIKNLTEYGRVVHSEMEALLMCARNGIQTRNCDMYVTTFPCHNCAKHIIDAGIKKVIYIEPYPKSKTFDFYKNEISEKESENKVLFKSFAGVGPHKFADLFSMNSTKWYSRKRKDGSGHKINWARRNAKLRTPMALMTYLEAERNAYAYYSEKCKEYTDEKK